MTSVKVIQLLSTERQKFHSSDTVAVTSFAVTQDKWKEMLFRKRCYCKSVL